MNTLYLDMDDVVADFHAYAVSILGRGSPSERWPSEEWNTLRSNPRIYRDLPKTTYADELVQECTQFCEANGYELKFLTAIPKKNDIPWVFNDKIMWAKLHFNSIPVMFGPYAVDKYRHCTPGDILIDDKMSNIEDWKQAGGIGILHKGNVIATVSILNSYLV